MEENSVFEATLEESIQQFDTKLDQDVAQLLKGGGHTICVAESVTGGLLGARLTSVPGSSEYFVGGVIGYHPRVKVTLCQVTPSTLQQYGAVSQEVALEMARGVQKLLKSDICVSTTGFAGPAASQRPIEVTGTVYIGVVLPHVEYVKRFQFKGERPFVRYQATQSAMVLVRQYLQNMKEAD